MINVAKGTCTYCGAKDVYICSTPESDCKCKRCHELTIANCKEAIKAINSISPKKRKSENKSTDELEHAMENAIKTLVGDGILLIDGKIVEK